MLAVGAGALAQVHNNVAEGPCGTRDHLRLTWRNLGQVDAAHHAPGRDTHVRLLREERVAQGLGEVIRLVPLVETTPLISVNSGIEGKHSRDRGGDVRCVLVGFLNFKSGRHIH